MLIAAILGQEFAIWRRDRVDRSVAYAPFLLALLLMAAAALASLADLTRLWGDPQNHWMQGHALWHVLTAAALYALFRFYAGMPRLPN